ncbi:MAG: hypothetical protein COW42_11815 [Deltaproteobacteria bacterium CG17_big_fil_post_rev_8_21_14_2_50_63_7]|nr:MAG: hypothetical protein COW42_11815 [Deltaproteobacteria bacterium CG17_big_fil_post_rev_8_21_14_2_50_63_7]
MNTEKELAGALRSLIDKIVGDRDEEGVKAAALDLGMLEDGEIRYGDEDELDALTDYYLFDQVVEGATRISAILASPPEALEPLERKILSRVPESHFSVFEVEARNPEVWHLIDLLAEVPIELPGSFDLGVVHRRDYVAMRVVPWGEQWLPLGTPLPVQKAIKAFFLSEEAVLDLAGTLPGSEEQAAGLTPLVLMRALIAARAAKALIEADGVTVRSPKRKRSLQRTSDKKRRRS